ncbi:MAG: hypothetical protein ACLUB5_01710 [Bifidobacterium dentium]
MKFTASKKTMLWLLLLLLTSVAACGFLEFEFFGVTEVVRLKLRYGLDSLAAYREGF